MRVPLGTRTETWASSLSVLQRPADQGVLEPLRLPGDLSQQQRDQVTGFVVQTAEVHGWGLRLAELCP